MSHGPHASLAGESRRDRFTAALFDELWDRYRNRVEYVRAYEQIVKRAGATFQNDHIAFRTFALQRPCAGIAAISRVFTSLGYQPAGVYQFPDKHLDAIHLAPPRPQFPKLFISELRAWELPDSVRDVVARVTSSHQSLVSLETLSQLTQLDCSEESRDAAGEMHDALVSLFCELPWDPPDAADVEDVNTASQYAAWVLVHGYQVNHFTALINSHGVEQLKDIERTVSALKEAGVPMKDDIEGSPGSKLRQTATAAVMSDVTVRRNGQPATMPWTYAYFELAERNLITDAAGNQVRFDGFLGPQATNLFEMTKLESGGNKNDEGRRNDDQ